MHVLSGLVQLNLNHSWQGLRFGNPDSDVPTNGGMRSLLLLRPLPCELSDCETLDQLGSLPNDS